MDQHQQQQASEQHYAGLDVSLDATSICVLDAKGAVVWRGKCLVVRYNPFSSELEVLLCLVQAFNTSNALPLLLPICLAPAAYSFSHKTELADCASVVAFSHFITVALT